MTKTILVVDDIVAEQHNLCLPLSDLDEGAGHVWAPRQGANGLIPKPQCQSALIKEVSPWI